MAHDAETLERLTDDAIRALAKDQWHEEGECEIDDAAIVSRSDTDHGTGAYVQAWVWVWFPNND